MKILYILYDIKKLKITLNIENLKKNTILYWNISENHKNFQTKQQSIFQRFPYEYSTIPNRNDPKNSNHHSLTKTERNLFNFKTISHS